MNEFVERKHVNNPDYELDLHVTGVILTHEKINWLIYSEQDYDLEYLIALFLRLIEVMQEGEIK